MIGGWVLPHRSVVSRPILLVRGTSVSPLFFLDGGSSNRSTLTRTAAQDTHQAMPNERPAERAKFGCQNLGIPLH